MYESPIELFTKTVAPKISETVDGMILDAVIDAGINVDRDELIKALAYDRGQYDKGYADGLAASPKWISVKDRLPTDPRFVLVYVKHPASHSFPAWSCIMTDMYLGDRWAENADEEVHEVTHWMPLPEPPKEEC